MRHLLFLTLFAIASCNHGVPMFFDQWPPISEPIEQDTCESWQHYSSPAFITGKVQFDSIPTSLVWMMGSHVVTLDQYFNDYKVFWNGRNLAILVKGTNNHSQYNGKLKIRGGDGKATSLAFTSQSLSLGGAATYEEFKAIQSEYKSVYWMNFMNFVGLDSLQYDTLISYQVDSCKLGRYRLDLRKIPCAQSRVDQAIEVGWDIVPND